MSSSHEASALSLESPELAFFTALRSGAPKIQCCERCGKRFFIPRTHCPVCRSSRYEWVSMTPAGTLYSYSEIPSVSGNSGRNVVLVDMDDGFRMMSTVLMPGPGGLEIGMRLTALVDANTEPPRIVFEEAGK
ncbi:Zn-ribbon domain-containing OB-fold protein [Cupriavidus oxalaticus]|uniref:DNA-binding protein n=1 Tax=Cupriavidus oxalaticus TaxID=96344 RepID=A0A5P3VCI8_9BURK|nr:OB-fold domain-containing protein [Cupriavidus oxalaticus]QEZ43960.1 DNA-binding protein [Cupriavidus oxalaticus]